MIRKQKAGGWGRSPRENSLPLYNSGRIAIAACGDYDEAKDRKLALVGERGLYDAQVLAPVLDAFAANSPFAPERMSFDDRTYAPYSRDDILSFADGDSSEYLLELRHKKRIKHHAFITYSHQPGISVALAPQAPAQDREALFAFADKLAAVIHPSTINTAPAGLA